jgi:hypothetical protein
MARRLEAKGGGGTPECPAVAERVRPPRRRLIRLRWSLCGNDGVVVGRCRLYLVSVTGLTDVLARSGYRRFGGVRDGFEASEGREAANEEGVE